MVNLLLRAGANANAPMKDGATPLYVAADANHVRASRRRPALRAPHVRLPARPS